MSSTSILRLPKLILGKNAYFVARAMKKPTFCIPRTIKNHQTSAKNASNASARKKEGLQGRLFVILDDFGTPQGGSKITKNQKKAFQKSIAKKGGKKGGDPPRPGSSAAAFTRPVGMQDSCSGRFLP